MTRSDHTPAKRRKRQTETLKRSELQPNKLRSQRKHRRRDNERSREWVHSPRDPSSFKDKVVVVSYNILGVENALKHEDLYFKVPAKMLEWNRRKKLIRKEIKRYKANILCLQEVDRFDDLSDLFLKDGFKGIYKGRTGEACDGCAIFWKEELFTLLHKENIEYQKFGLRNNVAQVCVLEMNDNETELGEGEHSPLILRSRRSRRFVIGNIHVLFNPNRGDIKLGQIRLLLEKASQLSRQWGSIPVILCGDLNSIPQSPMYQFLASSNLDIRLHDRRHISGQVEFQSERRDFRFRNEKASSSWTSLSKPLCHRWSEEELRLATGSGYSNNLQHHLRLCSAYADVPGSIRTRDNCGEPLATSFHSKFLGTVDYIWHTKELVPVRVLETLPINVLKKTGGLPSKKWGSDHLALVCELAFEDDKTATSSQRTCFGDQ